MARVVSFPVTHRSESEAKDDFSLPCMELGVRREFATVVLPTDRTADKSDQGRLSTDRQDDPKMSQVAALYAQYSGKKVKKIRHQLNAESHHLLSSNATLLT
jgi:hypothetical protein